MRADLRLRSRGGSVEENEGRGGGGGRERGAEDAEGDGPEDWVRRVRDLAGI